MSSLPILDLKPYSQSRLLENKGYKVALGDELTRILFHLLPFPVQHLMREKGFLKAIFDLGVFISVLTGSVTMPDIIYVWLKDWLTAERVDYGLSMESSWFIEIHKQKQHRPGL